MGCEMCLCSIGFNSGNNGSKILSSTAMLVPSMPVIVKGKTDIQSSTARATEAVIIIYFFSPSTSIILLNTLTETLTRPAPSNMLISSPDSAPL